MLFRSDPAIVEKLVADAEVVFHAAARNIVVSTKNPREDFETNIGGTLNVLLKFQSDIEVVDAETTGLIARAKQAG